MKKGVGLSALLLLMLTSLLNAQSQAVCLCTNILSRPVPSRMMWRRHPTVQSGMSPSGPANWAASTQPLGTFAASNWRQIPSARGHRGP